MTSQGRIRPRRLLLAATTAALAAVLAFAPRSTAGVYHVFSCRIPYGPLAGEAAPVQTATGAGEEAGRWNWYQRCNAQTSNSVHSEGYGLIAELQAGNHAH